MGSAPYAAAVSASARHANQDGSSSMSAWGEAIEEARQQLDFGGSVVPRNLSGIRAALRPDQLVALEDELSTLAQGAAFDAFLDHWWTQALADSASGAHGKELAIEFADLAVALRVRAAGGGLGFTQAEVEAMLKDDAS